MTNLPLFPLIHGHATDVLATMDCTPDLVVTDPPYAFGGTGDEHAISATVAVVLRECATRLKAGGWMLVFCASSWRSMSYMVEATRGIVEPVRVGTWTKPAARTKARTSGWSWASVPVIAFKKGKSLAPPHEWVDHISAAPVVGGRRAELPRVVADWAVAPFAVAGGVMLDPFAGSGALPQAAIRAGMNAYGIERSES
jgi:tRNA G10  N-methylase Trm11